MEKSMNTTVGNTRLGKSAARVSPLILATTVAAILTTPGAVGAVAVTTSATTEPAPEPAATTYTSTTFVVPFEVTPPDWVPSGAAPTGERPNLVTWESTDPDRAVRFFVPDDVEPPRSATRIPVPDDYVAYLLGQADHGVTFDDVVETTVDGRPATIVTETSPEFFHGSFGCEPDGGECWGCCTDDVVARLAVIDVGDQTLLVWQRDPLDAAPADYASFEEMLASLHFREGATPATEPAPPTTAAAVDSPIDGTWTTTVTREGLANSPLLYDTGELGDDNWVYLVLTWIFENGLYVATGHNNDGVFSETGTFRVDDDVLSIDQDNGEHFAFRWHIDADTLTLERDEALGEAPTPMILNPWTRIPDDLTAVPSDATGTTVSG
jgi:hypothetical protein